MPVCGTMGEVARTESAIRTLKHDAVRSAIWDAAIDLFAEKGFDEATVHDIAQAAGVSRRTFFRYFASKSDLMGQGIVTYGAGLSAAIAECPRNCSHLEVVKRTVLRIAEAAAGQPRTRKIIQIADKNAAAREAQLSRMGDAEKAVVRAYGDRLKSGRADEMTPRLLAALTLSILDVTFRLWFEQEAQDISDVAKRVFARLSSVIRTG